MKHIDIIIPTAIYASNIDTQCCRKDLTAAIRSISSFYSGASVFFSEILFTFAPATDKFDDFSSAWVKTDCDGFRCYCYICINFYLISIFISTWWCYISLLFGCSLFETSAVLLLPAHQLKCIHKSDTKRYTETAKETYICNMFTLKRVYFGISNCLLFRKCSLRVLEWLWGSSASTDSIFVNNLWSKMDENVNCLTKLEEFFFLHPKLLKTEMYFSSSLSLLFPGDMAALVSYTGQMCVCTSESGRLFLYRKNLFTESNDCLLILYRKLSVRNIKQLMPGIFELNPSHLIVNRWVWVYVCVTANQSAFCQTFSLKSKRRPFNQTGKFHVWTRLYWKVFPSILWLVCWMFWFSA